MLRKSVPRKHPGALINYFGGKCRTARKYPEPKYPVIIEPFCGGAGYSLLWREKDVVLCDLDDTVAKVWRYLLSEDPARIAELPLLAPGQTVDELNTSDGGRALIQCSIGPDPYRKSMTGYATVDRSAFIWGPARRSRTARTAAEIKHWHFMQCDYRVIPNIEATWFIDPPYQRAGKRYPHGSSSIDYQALAAWCRDRKGQVIVCENDGASWLPFEPMHIQQSARAHRMMVEAIWVSG